MNLLNGVIQFDKRKAIVGAILSVLVLIICIAKYDWFSGLAFSTTFLALGAVKLNVENKLCRYLLNLVGGIVVIIITWIVSVDMMNAAHEMSVDTTRITLNILCVCAVSGMLFLITAKWKLSIIVASFLLVFLSTANGFIFQFRGKELGPMDILSIKTAMNVAGQYTLNVTQGMAYAWIKWIMSAFLLFSLPKCPELPKIKVRLVALVLEVGVISALWYGASDIPIKTWDKQGTTKNGYYLNFFIGMRDSVVQKPDNYNLQEIENCAEKNMPVSNAEGEPHRPNVIVIMDESYVDFRVLGENFNTNQPVTPFMDSWTENTIRGWALSSVYGGNTANSEFEFLTGHSMAFLPLNSVPYQQYISDDIYTLAWLMKSYGYKSIATHPYYANGWSRNRNYPGFGFSESTFLENYSESEQVRDFVSDQAMFEYVVRCLNEKEEGKPLFLFGITMQNHGGYNYKGDNYEEVITLEGYSREYPKAQQYLNLIHKTDSAMEYLITTLKDYPEETIVLFFGDHFPKVETEFYEEVYGKSFDTLQEQMMQYTVPFVIWTNYDIPEQTLEKTSLNYLSLHLMNAAELELSSYHNFLAEMKQVVPFMNALGYYSVSRGEFIPYDEAEGTEAEWLNKYATIQYNNLFDEKNRNITLFGQYINHE